MVSQRRSQQREIILDVLRGTTAHPTAEWVYEEARKRVPRLSLGTVYRNLRLLAEKGDIQELELGAPFARYDGNARNHYHFACRNCGRVFDIDYPTDEELNRRVAEQTGFGIAFHSLSFYGLCQDCQQKRP